MSDVVDPAGDEYVIAVDPDRRVSAFGDGRALSTVRTFATVAGACRASCLGAVDRCGDQAEPIGG
ncbi:hypothetical protein ACWIGI_07670 [Nocardia sp. NPDC055321]